MGLLHMLLKHCIALGRDQFVADIDIEVQAITYLDEAKELEVACGVRGAMVDQVVGELVGLAVHLLDICGEPPADISVREQHAELDLELLVHLFVHVGIELLHQHGNTVAGAASDCGQCHHDA